MRRKSKNTLAILLAASMMTGLCSVPVAAAEEVFTEKQAVEADFDAQEVTVEEEDESASDELVVEEPETEVSTEEETDEIDISEEDADQEEVPAEEAVFDSGEAVFTDETEMYAGENYSDIGDFEVREGTADYDSDKKILTLNDAYVYGDIIFNTDEDVTVVLNGKNTIEESGARAQCH